MARWGEDVQYWVSEFRFQYEENNDLEDYGEDYIDEIRVRALESFEGELLSALNDELTEMIERQQEVVCENDDCGATVNESSTDTREGYRICDFCCERYDEGELIFERV